MVADLKTNELRSVVTSTMADGSRFMKVVSSNNKDPKSGFLKNGVKVSELIKRFNSKPENGGWFGLDVKSCKGV